MSTPWSRNAGLRACHDEIKLLAATPPATLSRGRVKVLRCLGCGGRVGSSQLAVARRPDSLHAAAGADEQCRGRQSHERHEQRVLDQVLSRLVFEKAVQVFHRPMVLDSRRYQKPDLVNDVVLPQVILSQVVRYFQEVLK